MREELYIITDTGRVPLDLNTPSGITLNFKSNILSDFSSITCSHSYTFKLPMTTHNRAVLDMADDIRYDSGMVRRKLLAEYVLNGMIMFSDANLYVESVESTAQAVMTWNVVKGLQTLKDSGAKLGDLLPEDESMLVDFGGCDDNAIDVLGNDCPVMNLMYSAGVPYVKEAEFIMAIPGFSDFSLYYTLRSKDNYSANSECYCCAYPLPVVPLRHLIGLINQKFGIRIDMGDSFSYSKLKDRSDPYVPDKFDLIRRGVLPMVGKDLTPAQLEEQRLEFTPTFVPATTGQLKTFFRFEPTDEAISTLMVFNDCHMSENTPLSISGATLDSGHHTSVLNSTIPRVSFEMSGKVSIKKGPGASAEDPKLTVYQVKGVADKTGGFIVKYELAEIASVLGDLEQDLATHEQYYVFDFLKESNRQLSLSELQRTGTAYTGGYYHDYNPCIFIGINQAISSFTATTITLTPDYADCIDPHKIDYASNLPGITVVDFVKSLFFMMGAFPNCEQSGRIYPVFFDDVRDNKSKAKDWSSKVYSEVSRPDKISYSCGGFARRNFYMTASDKADSTEKDKTDVFESGIGEITVSNETLDRTKTIIQLPFNAPYEKNLKTPLVNTGKTFKAWTWENETLAYCDPEPIVGLVSTRSIYNTATSENVDFFVMDCWNGFADMASNPSYAYLQQLMDKPYVITEYLRLDEFDLRDLDFSIPVYLDKYSAYFAVVSILRDSNGKCKCELLKLP